MAGAEIESVAEDGLVLVDFAAHVHVLRALAGKEKDRRGVRGGAGNRFFHADSGGGGASGPANAAMASGLSSITKARR